jgi:hypothetical protein
MYFTGFVCVKCGAAYPPDQDLLLCPACQNLLESTTTRGWAGGATGGRWY